MIKNWNFPIADCQLKIKNILYAYIIKFGLQMRQLKIIRKIKQSYQNFIVLLRARKSIFFASLHHAILTISRLSSISRHKCVRERERVLHRAKSPARPARTTSWSARGQLAKDNLVSAPQLLIHCVQRYQNILPREHSHIHTHVGLSSRGGERKTAAAATIRALPHQGSFRARDRLLSFGNLFASSL